MEIGKIQINTIGEKEQQGGTSGGGESNMEYLDVREIDFKTGGTKEGNLIALCYHMNGNHESIGDFVLPIGQVYVVQTSKLSIVRYLAVDFSSKAIMSGGINFTVGEMLKQTGWTENELAAIPRITKEQFYTL